MGRLYQMRGASEQLGILPATERASPETGKLEVLAPMICSAPLLVGSFFCSVLC